MQLDVLLDRVLRAAPPVTHASIAAFWSAHRDATRGLPPIERAILGGAAADRLAWAFAAGYAAALRGLVSEADLPEGDLAALAATEQGGAHPRAIATELRADGTLHG